MASRACRTLSAAVGLAALLIDATGSAAQDHTRILFYRSLEDAWARRCVFAVSPDGANLVQLTNGERAMDQWPDASSDGARIVYGTYEGVIHVMDANGGHDVALNPEGPGLREPRWSPDGRRIACWQLDPGRIWLMDADGADLHPLDLSPAIAAASPAWSPDGNRLVFALLVSMALATVPVTGGRMDTLFLPPKALSLDRGLWMGSQHPDWSPDGSRIAYSLGFDVWTVNADGSAPTNLTAGQGGGCRPSWSPGGSHLAFEGIREGDHKAHVYVMASDGSGRRYVTEGKEPSWEVIAPGTAVAPETWGAAKSRLWPRRPEGVSRPRALP